MEEDPEALELRERTYPWTKVHPFGVLKHANYTCCRSHLDRQRVLEFIYQHLHSIGMHHAAFTLCDESHLEFQRKDQKMDRTELRLLISMSLGPRDDLWDTTGIDSTVLVEEPFDDDNGSVNHVEPVGPYDRPPLDGVTFAGDAQSVAGIGFAPLRSLLVLLVNGAPLTVTDEDKQRFFLTLNSISRSEHVFAHLMALHDGASADPAIQANVLGFLEQWLRFSGLFMGKRTIDAITVFLQTVASPMADGLLHSLPECVCRPPAANVGLPPPIIDDAKELLHPRLSLAKPRAEEVARQISLMMHDLFSAIHPREFYAAIASRTLSLETPGINEFYQFGEQLKLLVAATLLSEHDLEAIPRQFEKMINIAKQLLDINNFEAVSWFVSAFNMKCVRNLRLRTQLKPAEMALFDGLVGEFDWKRPSDVYSEKIRTCFNQNLPAIQNMRYEFALASAGGYGGAEFENGAVNWAKRRKAAEFIMVYHHFQKIPFMFHPIAQIQKMLKRGSPLTKQQLIEMSIKLESSAKTE
jgi:hypothetical protein